MPITRSYISMPPRAIATDAQVIAAAKATDRIKAIIGTGIGTADSCKYRIHIAPTTTYYYQY